ncbi:MAG: TrkA C-terminal domain-containing protein [Chloroflexota bacterium]|nr:TrkA C-terminal domain-containing protein [Chloroflexota bacterium]MDE2839172.1 TrkA C-terminal domain-containing protein [Chloroflexota bacterium]MDE2930156.1 TrkA C-terminal domain-containing protein [Chloroflexota bacterium]
MAVAADSGYAGMDLTEFAAAHSLQVLAISKQDGQLLFSPATDVVLDPGDRVVVAGDDAQLQHLKGDA